MPTAPAAEQQTLLELQDVDTRIAQAGHRRENLPVIQRIGELTARVVDLDTERVERGAEVGDLQRQVDKADDDVQAVRSRAQRDTARLESGEGTPRDLQALQSELEVLARRQAELEEIEIELMQQLEDAQRRHDEAARQLEELGTQIAELEDERDQAVAQIDAEIAELEAQRGALAARIGAELLALYEKLRAQYGGIGAAALRGRTCEGCHLDLNAVEVNRINAESPDQVLRCEECGRILVRGAA